MKFFTDFPFEPLETLRDFVGRAERAGYAGVLATDNRHDPFLPIAASAGRGNRVAVGTAFATLLAYNPFQIAKMAWDLHYNTGEQFILGLGTHLDVHLSARLGIAPEAKHARFSEALKVVCEVWRSWVEDRHPHFEGRYYSINVCPPGYRPTTRLNTMPKVYIMCSSPADIELAAAQGDGVFIHPMWVRSFIDSHVWPALAASGRQLAIIDGGVIATGAVGDEIEQSRDEARKRVIGYWCSANYDDVFRAIGVMPLIEDFRADVAARRPIWDRETTRELYSTFVCDASLDDLADRLRLSRSRHVTGVFPNVMSCIRRILPRALISEVATIQPAG